MHRPVFATEDTPLSCDRSARALGNRGPVGPVQTQTVVTCDSSFFGVFIFPIFFVWTGCDVAAAAVAANPGQNVANQACCRLKPIK